MPPDDSNQNCTNGQADLNLCSAHLSEGTLSGVAAHIITWNDYTALAILCTREHNKYDAFTMQKEIHFATLFLKSDNIVCCYMCLTCMACCGQFLNPLHTIFTLNNWTLYDTCPIIQTILLPAEESNTC